MSCCVRLYWERQEQTPARAIHADLSEFRSADGGQKVKQDKEQASSVAPCSVTSARSAGSYGGFRAFQSGVKIEGVLSLLRSSSPRAYSYKKKVGVMPRKRCYCEQKKISSALPNARAEDVFFSDEHTQKLRRKTKNKCWRSSVQLKAKLITI